ncbi:polymorphic toxin-type HINT domain-containing protein [Leptospira mtsangambouensis]|uniref:polymorphic toxin-type HINT domain-containing protein n=1 Tax=Leptospira mtsangambouensis TaxID=2484912 RepID=UPI001EEB3B94|nr:polymorphic toxin-type HINT domain-containing protein [Leptospira mtsangambouensis]MCG6142665.1 hypothetical protein [Leptospira mtsangambouensis]
MKKKTDWEVNLLNQARKGDQFEIDQVYAEIQKTIANMGSVPNTVLLQNNANKILNTIMNSKPQVLDNRMLEQGMYADVQFFVDELQKSKYDESNVEKMKSMTKEMEDRSKQMAVLQTLDSLWSLPLTFEATIAEQNKALDEQLTMQLLQDNFIKMGPGYVRSAVDKMGNPSYQILPTFSSFLYIKPDKLPTVKDSDGKEWDLTDYQSLQGKNGPASGELTTMVRLARNQMQTDFKLTYDPEKSENREVGFTMLDPKAMAKVAQAAQSAMMQFTTDPQKMFEFNSADEKGKEAMVEAAKNSGYLVGPTVGGAFGTHHFNQYYPILKMKEMYNEIKAEGESVQGDPFVKSAKSLGGPMAASYVAKNLDTLKAVDSVLSSIPIVDRLNPLAMLKSFGNGGILGVVTNVASVVTETASLILSGLTTKVSVDYSYDNGFGASVDFGFGVGAARVSVANASYSEHGGFAASIGVTGKIGSVELGARVTYSEKEGFGASVGAKVGNFVAGVSYTQNGGFGAQVGYKNSNGAISGLSYSEKTGLSASVGVTNGDYSGGLSYNAQEGFGAFVARNDYDKATDKTSGSQALTFNQRDGVGVKVSSNTANGDHSVGISQRGGINYEGSYNGHTVSANYSKDGGFGVSYTNGGSTIEYSSQSGFSGSYNNNNNPAYGDIVGNSVVTSQGALMGAMDSIAENVHGEYMEVDRAKKKWLESKGPIKFPEGKSSWDDLTDEEKETLVQNKSAEINGKPKRDQHTTRDSVWERMKGNVSDFADQLGGTYGDHSGWIDPKTGQFVDRTCFVAGTKVHTKDGLKNIEDIQVGDVVLSWNEKTGEREYKVVTELFLHEINQLYEVKTTKGTTLETTWNHPFWVVDRKEWVEVKDLQVGDVLALADGALVEISHIRSYYVEPTKVYNFEVEDNHSYFVGEDGVLVHNYDYSKGLIQEGDTLKKITDEINKREGTNYTEAQVAEMNGIKVGNQLKSGERLLTSKNYKNLTDDEMDEFFSQGEKSVSWLVNGSLNAEIMGIPFGMSYDGLGVMLSVSRKGHFQRGHVKVYSGTAIDRNGYDPGVSVGYTMTTSPSMDSIDFAKNHIRTVEGCGDLGVFAPSAGGCLGGVFNKSPIPVGGTASLYFGVSALPFSIKTTNNKTDTSANFSISEGASINWVDSRGYGYFPPIQKKKNR